MKRLLKRLLILLCILLLLIGLVAAAIAWVAGTDSGFSFAARQADQRLDMIGLSNVNGNLASGVDGESVEYTSETLNLKATGISTDWRTGCLLQREFCLDSAVIEEVYIETFATDKPSPEPSPGDIVLPSIQLPINVTMNEVRVKKLRFKGPGVVPEQLIENIVLSASTDGSQLTIQQATADYQNYQARLNGMITLEDNYPLDLTVELRADDIIEDNDVAATVRLGNHLDDLSIDVVLDGAVQAQLTGTVSPLQKNLPVDLTLTAAELGWPLDTGAQARATDLGVTINGTLDDYALSVNALIGGEQIPETRLSLNGRANTERLELPGIDIDTLGGGIEGSAGVSWKNGLSWLTDLDISNIDPSIQLPNLPGRLDGEVIASGSVAEGNFTLDVSKARIEGELSNYPFVLDARLDKGLDERWNIEKLKLDNGNNRLNAAGTVGQQWDIQASAQLPELQNFLPGLAGGFNADVAVTGELQTPSLVLDASSALVKFNDLLIQGISVKADVSEAGLNTSTLAIAAGSIRTGTQEVRNLRLGLDGTRNEHALTLFADGPEATAIDLALNGSLSDTVDWLGSLDAVTLELPAHTLVLEEPAGLEWNQADKQFSVDPHCWLSEDARLCLEERVAAQAAGEALITFEGYKLSRLNPFLPSGSTLLGKVTADVAARWGEAQPGGFSALFNTSITEATVRFVDPDDNRLSFGFDSLTLVSDLDGLRVKANMTLESDTIGAASIDVQLDDPTSEEKPISGRIDLEGFNIGIAQAFLPQLDKLSGTISANGDLSGQLTDPRFDGEVVLADPIAEALILPLALTGGRLITTIKGKRAFIDGQLASGEGTITIEGSANWQQEAWQADINLVGDQLNIIQAPLQSSIVNHDLRILARPGIVRMTGEVNVPSAFINVRDVPKGAVTLSDDVIVVEDIENEAEAPVDPPGGLEVVAVVDVNLGDEVSVEAYGLKSKLGGDMTINIKTPNSVNLSGEILVIDGIYKQYGQNLKADGSVLFVGPVNQTRLAIDAIREIDNGDRVAGLKIGGTVVKPEIGLFTEPADKSQEAILSYIVLGRDIGETNDQQANLLATAALALSVKGGRSVTTSIADRLGIEEFSFETRGRGEDTELVVSGRVNDRVVLTYGQGIFGGDVPTYTARYEFTKKLYVEAASGVAEALDIFYSFSF